MPEERHVDQAVIKVNGSDLPTALMDSLLEIVVDVSLHLPDMFILRFHDNDLRWVDQGPFEPGAAVEIELGKEGARTKRVLSGEITAVEPDFGDNASVILTVRGYDRSHRLTRGSRTRVYVQMTDSDIVAKIADEAGLQVNAESTGTVYDHVFQHSETDLAFLQQRAYNIGYEVFVDDRTLYFRKPRGDRGALELDWGEDLRSFHPRMTLVGQVNDVTVKGWDPQNKREIVSRAQNTETAPEIDIGGQGGDVATHAFSTAAEQLIIRRPVTSQAEADSVAQAILDEINASFVEAEGVATGNPDLVAGQMVNLTGLGSRFSGSYMVTSAAHVYSAQRAYEIRFRVEGARPTLMADLLRPPAADSANGHDGTLWGGVVPAMVTNNKDDQNMSRVKLKFPWLDDELESHWARVSGVGAGKERGIYWLPEVNDEVLVAFEHGDFQRPYVVGGLWNGQDAPPEPIDKAIKEGQVHTRTIKTRTGHTIRLVDDDAGDQYIEIIDAAEGTTIKMDSRSKAILIKADGDVTVDAGGTVKIKAGKEINLEAGTDINMKAVNIKLDAQSNAEVKANANIDLKASASLTAEGSGSAELKGASTKVQGSAMLDLSGGLVKIN